MVPAGLLVSGFLLLFGCAGTDGGASLPPGSPDLASCAGASGAAAKRVLDVAGANVACAADADCATVNVGASCFDACTRSVNQAGKGAVDRAQTLVEAGECKPFHAGGCKLTPPPCAPPAAPACKAGRCE